MGAAKQTVDLPPVRTELVHQSPEPGTVARLQQVNEFMDHHTPQARRRLLGQLQAQPDPPPGHAAGAPAGAHVPNADFGRPLTDDGLAFLADRGDRGEHLSAVPVLDGGLALRRCAFRTGPKDQGSVLQGGSTPAIGGDDLKGIGLPPQEEGLSGDILERSGGGLQALQMLKNPSGPGGGEGADRGESDRERCLRAEL